MLLLILIHHKSYQETQLHITANGGSGRYVASELSRHFKIDVTVTHRHKEKNPRTNNKDNNHQYPDRTNNQSFRLTSENSPIGGKIKLRVGFRRNVAKSGLIKSYTGTTNRN